MKIHFILLKCVPTSEPSPDRGRDRAGTSAAPTLPPSSIKSGIAYSTIKMVYAKFMARDSALRLVMISS